jgi:hypothetical protein
LPDKEPDDGLWIAPDVALSRQALGDLMKQMEGAPIWAPSSEPKQRPLIVTSFSERLAGIEPDRPTLSFGEIAAERMDALDALGLGSDDPERLRKHLLAISSEDHEALIRTVFRAGKATLDRLRENTTQDERPTTLWASSGNARRVAAQTLLWADHYLVNDALASALLDSPSRADAPELAPALLAEFQLRPLLQAGVVVLVPQEVAQVLAADDAYRATKSDLDDPVFVRYVASQLWTEGPTAREVLFVHARDGNDLGQMFSYGHIDGKNDDGTFTTSQLAHRYDPAHDYSPWIEHVLRQSTAARVQRLNLNVAIAETLGGQCLVQTPFEARLLSRKGVGASKASPLLWADIPSIPEADPDTLARIAAEDDTVKALRRTVRRGMNAAVGDGGRAAAEEIAEQLREEAELLRVTMQRDRVWRLAAPGGLGVAGLIVGGLAGGPVGVAAAALGAAAGLVSNVADRATHRSRAAYAVLLADRAHRTKERKARSRLRR